VQRWWRWWRGGGKGRGDQQYVVLSTEIAIVTILHEWVCT
jgi:hypothetical protein